MIGRPINEDLKTMTNLIAYAARQSFLELFKNGETFYYCTLITTGEGFAPVISAWSQQALERAVQNMDEEKRQWIKWSYADAPYLAFGQAYFAPVEKLFSARLNIEDANEETWEIEFNIRRKAMEAAMKQLDEEGIFSLNQPRENICILAEVMPPDTTNTAIAKRLNNPNSRAMKDWLKEIAE